ncbi:GIY-YIG nuclease family protein [Neobacillus niacini]|uniref:GIY-YIG nuclease family protein n=1 Tax=Neobacillus niacini TaxID=86668 RepID=UPI001C8D038F|nr:GIY-YIG nuclease family protein [Neobacillus niacini]MBY0147769.1 GIY-YIG nuclease family protein [Neobacillus niacini]
MKHELLSRGIYAILNKNLKLVYVGQTQRNFLIRWTEHLMRIQEHVDNFERLKLFLHEDTKFLILKKLDDPECIEKNFIKLEQEAYEFYRKKHWGIVSTHHFNTYSNYRGKNLDDERLLDRYRKAIIHMSFIISTKNTNHKNGSVILINLYNQIEKKFQTNVKNRGGSSILSTLTQNELEFMLLELYPRFFNKKLAVLRKELNNTERQISLF